MEFQLEKLEYDSQRFGYNVAKIEINQDISKDKFKAFLADSSSDFQLLYIFLDPHYGLNSELLSLGCNLADQKLVYSRKLKGEKFDFSDKIEIYSSPFKNDDSFLDLAYQSGEYSRFKTDANFKNDEFKKIYTDWLAKSVNRELASDILVYRIEGRIVGFITYKIDNISKTAEIGLIAVDKNYRGQGIGKKLMYSFFSRIQETCNSATVATQSKNAGARAFYESSGFELANATNIYHFWNYENSI